MLTTDLILEPHIECVENFYGILVSTESAKIAMEEYAKEVAVHYLQHALSKMFPSTFSSDTPISKEAYLAFDKFMIKQNREP